MKMNPPRSIRCAAVAFAVVGLLGVAGCGDSSEAGMLASAKELREKNDANAAVVQLKSTIQKYPKSSEARYQLGSVLLNAGDASAALIELEKARELGADSNMLLPTLAKAMVARGQLRKVVGEYGETTLTDRRAAAELKTQVAWAYYRMGVADRWQKSFGAALELDPKNEGARLQQTLMLAQAGKYDDALATVNTVLADNPKQLEAWVLKGELLARAKSDPEGASAAWREALAVDPRYLPAHAALINLMQRRGLVTAYRAQVGQLKKALPDAFDTRFYDT